MAITNPKKLVSMAGLNEYHIKDKAERATAIAAAVAVETTARTTADTTLQENIDEITEVIPAAASTTNQLVDTAKAKELIAALGGVYRGSFDNKSTKETSTSTTLDGYTGDKEQNDYAYVRKDETQSNGTTLYIYNGSAWVFAIVISTASLTPTQIAALDSGITSTKVSEYEAHEADTDNPHEVTLEQAVKGSGLTLSAYQILMVNDTGKKFELKDAAANSDIDEIFV